MTQRLITTPAIAAAFRLAATLPRTVHYAKPRPQRKPGGAPPREISARRREQIRRWLEEGTMTWRDMHTALGISKVALHKHIKAIRNERKLNLEAATSSGTGPNGECGSGLPASSSRLYSYRSR